MAGKAQSRLAPGEFVAVVVIADASEENAAYGSDGSIKSKGCSAGRLYRPAILPGAQCRPLAPREEISHSREIDYTPGQDGRSILRGCAGLHSSPMTEVWLRANRRVLAFALIPTGLLALVGILLGMTAEGKAARMVGW